MFLKRKAFSNNKMIDLSIVIPAYNEEKNIIQLYNELKEILENLKKSYEIIVVDDGGKDKTFDILKTLKKSDKKLKVIRLQKNFKKAAALSAGFDESKGNIIITMDADLQDDPKEIPKLIRKLNEGYDIVVGWKYKRKDALLRKINSKIFNTLVRILTKVKVHDSDCNFRAIKKDVIKHLPLYGGLYRHIPSIAYHQGYKVGEVNVIHRARKFGKSRYGVTRLFTGFFDLITIKFLLSYQKSPMHLFAIPGSILSISGFLISFYLAFIRLFLKIRIGERPLLLLAILLIVLGIQFVSIGLIGEMISNKDNEKKYIIKNKLT